LMTFAPWIRRGGEGDGGGGGYIQLEYNCIE
jgi:hypothetical protein